MQYESFQLDNGLTVIVHEDHSTKTAVLNLLYNVGSKDENPNKTGFAHLFEHLMFGGSKNIDSFDEPLQKVGGENNAFTTPDITNYYVTVPSANIETAFWLESDRMLSLSFDPNVLEVQRKVVIEEFKQRYLNQPYGDVWLKLRPEAYKVHPYSWATIGKEISHIEDATMQDVKEFFYKFYIPNNAYLVVAGDVTVEQVKRLSQKWFGPIPAGKEYVRDLPQEPVQNQARNIEISSDVPLNSLYKVFHMEGRLGADYYSSDLMSDILGRGKSSRLYSSLVSDQNMFSKIGASILGSHDPGLVVISGDMNDGVSFDEAEQAIENELVKIINLGVTEEELAKVKMQAESSHVFGEMEVLNRAMNLAISASLGDIEMVNRELNDIISVSTDQLKTSASRILRPDNCTTLRYYAEGKKS
ncbi:M16 family metallopeptidase [Reichenbachiella versicolor]|uniref:M16 family metallopeptidase n=1 Tax=Reichenbachiella versicolor TaxID=1821036 RepID=UPI001FE41683|nr:pitrilysin family protein [Reichenbachiella versicolor]